MRGFRNLLEKYILNWKPNNVLFKPSLQSLWFRIQLNYSANFHIFNYIKAGFDFLVIYVILTDIFFITAKDTAGFSWKWLLDNVSIQLFHDW